MLDEHELRALGIIPWQDCAADFAGADLLLGNGFSVNLTGVFSYGSLFDKFLTLCDPAYAAVLRGFGTSNFESILEDLGTTKRVNTLLALPSSPVRDLADAVREGLVATIEQVHPRKANVNWRRLERIAQSFDEFGNVFTLNYDALLYHIVMIAKERDVPNRITRYNDYFWERISVDHLRFMGFQNYPYKHLYYLHGALFLFTLVSDNFDETEVKRSTSGNNELLDAIASAIRSGNLPLFVSEGTSAEKRRAIESSPYLRFANDHLRANRDRLVIYGASLGDQDAHIAEAINSSTERAAISIYVGNKSGRELTRELKQMKAELFGVDDPVFFDSSTLFV